MGLLKQLKNGTATIRQLVRIHRLRGCFDLLEDCSERVNLTYQEVETHSAGAAKEA
jgi:hypothetical protein